MTMIHIRGANGLWARNTTKFLPQRTGERLTLYLRRADRLRTSDSTGVLGYLISMLSIAVVTHGLGEAGFGFIHRAVGFPY